MMLHDQLHKLWKKLQIRNGAEAAAAALFSVPLTCLISWLVSRIYFNRYPVYSEFVAGGTVYDGYNKQGDMCFFYLLILLLPVLFGGYLLFRHYLLDRYKLLMAEKSQAEGQDGREGEKESDGEAQEESKREKKNSRADASYVNQTTIEELQAIREKRAKKRENIAVPLILGYGAIRAVFTALTGHYRAGGSLLARIEFICLLGWVGFILIFDIIAKKKKRDLAVFKDRTSAVFQLFLPVAFLGYTRFYYDYANESALIELYHSTKWRGFCFLLAAGLILWQCLRIYRKKKGVSACSFAVLAVMITATQPEGILSVDFFHNGEMALPMQQLLSYGKIPYFDLDPIHGFCDFFYSIFNYMFFDGSYFSQNAAVMVAQMLVAAVLGALIGYFARDDAMKLACILVFMPYLVEKAGIRYFIFFAAFIILLSDKVRKNSHCFLWWWGVLSMAGIAFHVSIGAGLAVAFLPEALYRFIKDVIPDFKGFVKKDIKEKRGLIFLYGSLVLLGIAYIPWFIQILRYLKENAGTTLWVNGTPVFGTEFQPVETFAFLAVYLAFIILALGKSSKGRSAFVSMACCMTVIFNYSCVRYDEGLRLAVLGVFFCFLLLIYLYQDCIFGRYQALLNLLIAGMCFYICYAASLYGTGFQTEYIPAEKEVEIQEKTVSDPIVFVSGDSVGMPNLGTGFIQGLTLNSLKNIQTVLENEGAWDSWLDLTNKISHSVIFDSEVKYPFTSAYNISNGLLQEKMLESIQKEKPHLILLSPYIHFDQAPVSLRSPKLYAALLGMGYQPYAYEDVIYLLDGESRFEEAVAGERRLGNLNHRTQLGMLPYLWGTAKEERTCLTEFSADCHRLNGKEVFYMELVADASLLSQKNFTLTFQSDVDGEFYDFVIDTGIEKLQGSDREICYMIPLGSSPFFTYSKNVDMKIKGIVIKEMHFYK